MGAEGLDEPQNASASTGCNVTATTTAGAARNASRRALMTARIVERTRSGREVITAKITAS